MHFPQPKAFHFAAQIVIGSVWIFHGIYSKILDGIPRHRLIVGRILGTRRAALATKVIGILEALLGVWVFTGSNRALCAGVQTLAILAMNSLEIILARELLISAGGMVVLNAVYLTMVWYWALLVS